jgi:UDP-glucose 4-epimerase
MGSNKGYSVKEVIEMYEKANGIKLNYTYGERRSGDAIIALPDCTKIQKELR